MKHQKALTSIGTAAIALSAILSQQTANAALLAYEGFDYTPGILDSTKNGGTGWSQPWVATPATGIAAPNQQVLSGGFGYTDGLGNILNISGNRAHVTGDGATDGLVGGVGTTTSVTPTRGLTFSRGTSGATESTWISFIALRTGAVQPVVAPAPNDHLYGRAASAQFFYNSASSTTGGSEMFGIGRATQSSETIGAATALPNDTWGVLQQGNANATKASTVNWASGADFLLMRIDHVGSTVNDASNADTIRLWINPNLNVAPLDGAADVTFKADEFNAAGVGSINRDFIFNRFRIFGGGTNATQGYGSIEMDEIRIGEGFADVTPYTAVPEPAIAALGGLGALALIMRRRRG